LHLNRCTFHARTMEPLLQNHRVLFFVGDCYEDLELWYPL